MRAHIPAHQFLEFDKSQKRLRDAAATMAWFAGHPSVFKGYCKWVHPFRYSDEWAPPPVLEV
jgi:hypothetical protein